MNAEILHCSCGYATSDPGEYADHFLDAFGPDVDMGTDGQAHAEAAHDHPLAAGIPPLARACLCGYAAGDLADMDMHLILAIAPAGFAGIDGGQHIPAGAPTVPSVRLLTCRRPRVTLGGQLLPTSRERGRP